jgi:hypothetical protein
MNHERFGEEGEKHWREQKPERRSVRGSKWKTCVILPVMCSGCPFHSRYFYIIVTYSNSSDFWSAMQVLRSDLSKAALPCSASLCPPPTRAMCQPQETRDI